MKTLFERIEETKDFLIQKGIESIDLGVVLGTGLGSFIHHVEVLNSIDYEEIPNFPTATVEFHSGKLILAQHAGKKLLIMQGRFHFYEGHSFESVGFGIRIIKALGAKILLMSGAAGKMRPDWNKGDLMLLKDHIHLLPGNPLIGLNDDRLGPRFPDMHQAYDSEIGAHLKLIALKQGIMLREGVYVSAQGPMLETAAEYGFLQLIGADAVGMSTTPEVIVANHSGLKVACVVVLTDECDPKNLQPINIAELLAVAGKAEQHLISIFKGLIAGINA
jgi:purine-nucleoside phosphorylase